MSTRTINLNHTVFTLCSHDDAIAPIMAQLGFTDVLNPGMLSTAGRFMTLPKAAALKHIPLNDIIRAFEAQGYTVTQ